MIGFASLGAQTHRGKASYYAKRATGARTASGVKVHHDSLTCAHKSYPFGTILQVTNLSNDKVVYVKVTDRGPFGRGRIIDLSYGAARELGMLAQGVAMVEVKRVDDITPPFRMDETERGLPYFEFDIKELGVGLAPDYSDVKPPTKKTVREKMRGMDNKAKQAPEKLQKNRAAYSRAHFNGKQPAN